MNKYHHLNIFLKRLIFSVLIIITGIYSSFCYAQDGVFGAPQIIHFPFDFSLPGAVVYHEDSDRVYVLETGAHRMSYASLANALNGISWTSPYLDDENRRTHPNALNEPQGIAIDSGHNIYIADTYNNRVMMYRYIDIGTGSHDLDLNFVRDTRTIVDGVAIDRPRDICVAPDDTIYLLDTGNRRILSATGPDARRWRVHYASTDWIDPRGLTVAADGTLYVANTGGHSIVQINTDGSVESWGSYGTHRGKLRFPHDVALDSSGRIYVADTHNHRIAIFDSRRNYFRSLGTSPLLRNPEKIFVDSVGRIFIADLERDDIVAFLGPDYPPRYDGYIRTSPLDDGSEPFSNPDNLLSPDILIRNRADINLTDATSDGFRAFGSDAIIPGNEYYVYLMLHNRGEQPLPPGELRLYTSPIDTVEPLYQFPEEWSDAQTFRYQPTATTRIQDNSLRLAEIPGTSTPGAGTTGHHRSAVGPLVWRPTGSVSGCENEMLLMARHANLYDPTQFAEGLEQVAISNNVAIKSIPFVEASCIPSLDRYESNDRLADATIITETWTHLHERCAYGEVRGSGTYPDAICADPFENNSSSLHSEEIWSMEIRDLSLHSRHDEDFLTIPLPDFTNPTYGVNDINTIETRTRYADTPGYEPAVMPECGSVLRQAFGPEGADRDSYVNVSTELVIEVFQEGPPESTVAPRPFDMTGESLQIYDGDERNPDFVSGTRFRKRLNCPQSRRDMNEVTISLGERFVSDTGDERLDARDLLATGGYKIALSYISSIDWQTPGFIDELGGARELGCIGLGRFSAGPSLPSLPGGGANFIPRFRFPFCADFGRFGFFDRFPFNPKDNCLADGPDCWDISSFNWPSTEIPFDLVLIGVEPLEITLINPDGKPIQAQHMNTKIAPHELIQLTSIDLKQFDMENQPSPAIYSTRLQMQSLPAGSYGLSIKGTPSKYAVSMITPALKTKTPNSETPLLSSNHLLTIVIILSISIAISLLLLGVYIQRQK